MATSTRAAAAVLLVLLAVFLSAVASRDLSAAERGALDLATKPAIASFALGRATQGRALKGHDYQFQKKSPAVQQVEVQKQSPAVQQVQVVKQSPSPTQVVEVVQKAAPSPPPPAKVVVKKVVQSPQKKYVYG